jgi:hypothetical protein
MGIMIMLDLEAIVAFDDFLDPSHFIDFMIEHDH